MYYTVHEFIFIAIFFSISLVAPKGLEDEVLYGLPGSFYRCSIGRLSFYSVQSIFLIVFGLEQPGLI